MIEARFGAAGSPHFAAREQPTACTAAPANAPCGKAECPRSWACGRQRESDCTGELPHYPFFAPAMALASAGPAWAPSRACSSAGTHYRAFTAPGTANGWRHQLAAVVDGRRQRRHVAAAAGGGEPKGNLGDELLDFMCKLPVDNLKLVLGAEHPPKPAAVPLATARSNCRFTRCPCCLAPPCRRGQEAAQVVRAGGAGATA